MCKVDIDHWRCPYCNQDIVGGGYPGYHGAVNQTSWKPCRYGRPYSRSCPNLDATRRVHYDEVCSICKEIQATIKKH